MVVSGHAQEFSQCVLFTLENQAHPPPQEIWVLLKKIVIVHEVS